MHFFVEIMREEKENPSENRSKVSKFSDQNQPPKPQTTKGTNPNNNGSKTRLWGAHIVKGFSADKKAKPFATKKQTLTSSTATSENVVVANQKSNGSNPFVPSHSRVKRSLIGDLSCSINPAQVHPHAFPTHRRQSSTDLFTELDHMRGLLQESKERECKLNAELAECRKRVSEVDEIVKRVGLLEQEKATLTEQLAALTCEEVKGEVEQHKEVKVQNLELEVVELRRLNKELQMQKRNLTCRLSSIEAQSHCPDKSSEVHFSISPI